MNANDGMRWLRLRLDFLTQYHLDNKKGDVFDNPEFASICDEMVYFLLVKHGNINLTIGTKLIRASTRKLRARWELRARWDAEPNADMEDFHGK